MEQSNQKRPKKPPDDPPLNQTHDPTREYELLVDQALLGVLGQEPLK